jgi:peptide/nickel transport system substrate-binding protein
MRASNLSAACAAALALAVFLAACGPHSNSQRSANEKPGVVTFLIDAAPTNLDPRLATDAESQHLDGLIFSSLVALDDQMRVIPDLAERWETPDPLTYVFHLRRGVRFHDGRVLTAADVKFTFDSILGRIPGEAAAGFVSPKAGGFAMVESVSAPDDATVIFKLREPSASFVWSMARPAIGIVPAGAGADFADHPIGTGPFRFVSAVTDEEIVLARNANYFGGHDGAADGLRAPAKADGNAAEIHFRIVPDATGRALELQKGSADLALNSLTPDMVEALRKDSRLEITEQPGTSVAYLAINCGDAILGHREVRQALAYATDRQSLIRYLLRGQARPADGLLPPGNWAYSAGVKDYAYDPARAEQLMDAAGFPRASVNGGGDGRGGAGQPRGMRFTLTLKTSTEESARLIGAGLQDQWRRVGIALNLRPLEFATFYADVTRGAFGLAYLRWVGANNDPDIYDYVFNSRHIPPNGANRGRYVNPEMDKLLDAERVEMDPVQRALILFEIQRDIAEDEPYVMLWFPDNVAVHRRRIGNVHISPSGDYDFLTSITVR